MNKKKIAFLIITLIAFFFLVTSTIKAFFNINISNVQIFLFFSFPGTLIVFVLIILQLNSIILQKFIPKNCDEDYLPNLTIIAITNKDSYGEKKINFKKVKKKQIYVSCYILIENRGIAIKKLGLKGIKIKNTEKKNLKKNYFSNNVKLMLKKYERIAIQLDFNEKEYKLLKKSQLSVLLNFSFERKKKTITYFKNFNFYDRKSKNVFDYERVFTYYCQINGEKFKNLNMNDNTMIQPQEYSIISDKFILDFEMKISKNLMITK